MRYLIYTITLLALLVSGCSDKSTTPVPSDQNQQTTEEMPTEVQTLLDEYTFEDTESVPLFTPGEGDLFPPDLFDDSWDVYVVTYLWGQLYNTSAVAPQAVDWSGTLSANGDIVIYPVFPISFEKGQDSILTDLLPNSESWVSVTDYDFDGIVFLVFYNRDVTYITPPQLTFDTEPFDLSLDFGQLDHFSAFYKVDDAGCVGVYAHRLKRVVCERGYITGDWIKDEPFAKTGRFDGYWMDDSNNPVGYLNGRFWADDTWTGTGQFEGAITGLITDEVIGTVKGVWLYDDLRMCPMCGEDHGWMKGRVTFNNSDKPAMMTVELGWPNEVASTTLPMKGKWWTKCSNADPTDITLLD